MAPKAASQDADPDRLVRQKAGSYRTEDDRFEVQESANGWFIVDSEQANEFGQPLLHGPFATLNDVRAALPEARKTAPTPRPSGGAKKAAQGTKRKAAGKAEAKTEAKTKPKAEAPPPPPPSWIDRLSPAEARDVRALIRAAEREELPDAEQLVRRDREGLAPIIAEQLIERRIDALIDDLPAGSRDDARKLVAQVLEALSADAGGSRAPLPTWRLVEVTPGDEPPNRRIVLRR